MSIQRIGVLGLLAAVCMAVSPAHGQDFHQRYAAWQGGGAAPQRMTQSRSAAPAMSSAPQEIGGEAEARPSPRNGRAGSQRILDDVYDAPVHTPDYNNPWTNSSCSACAHRPTFEPASDVFGTCDYAGGGPLSCGPSCGGGCGGGCLSWLGRGRCGPCGACGGAGGGCDYGPSCCNTLVWLRLETLLWWRQGRDYPPLVTTDPATEPSDSAGVLPDAHILFGGRRDGTTMQAGGRIDFGTFLDPTQCVGIGDRVWGLGRDSQEFHVASNDVPVLAIPFRDPTVGQTAHLVAYPGLPTTRTGSINISASSGIVGNDVYLRFLLCRDCVNRWDFITGWNYTRMADEIQIRSRTTVVADPTVPVGTVLTTLDQFRTSNNFNGGILGLQWSRNCGYWTTQLMGRMSLGNMHEVLLINGENRVDGDVNDDPVGGIFTRDSNIGRHARNEFTAITEVGLNVGYRFAPCTTLNLGYSFMYWNDVLSPANNIDTTVDTQGGGTRPAVLFRHNDFWVQGINLGLTKEF